MCMVEKRSKDIGIRICKVVSFLPAFLGFHPYIFSDIFCDLHVFLLFFCIHV